MMFDDEDVDAYPDHDGNGDYQRLHGASPRRTAICPARPEHRK